MTSTIYKTGMVKTYTGYNFCIRVHSLIPLTFAVLAIRIHVCMTGYVYDWVCMDDRVYMTGCVCMTGCV